MTRFIRWTLAFTFVLCLVGAAFSQSRNTGEIRGTVSAAGAVVQGATVTLTNVDTGETKTFVTNDDGIYDTVSTPAGNYKISITAKGFKTTVIGPIVLQVDVITENASLDVGAITETVNVEAPGAPLLETETTNLGAILEAKTIQALPQIGAGITGNDWANFNIFLPGASSAPSQPTSEGSGAYNAGDAISLNGNLPNYANYLQDGGVVQLPVSNNVDNTLFEAVQEVQITTSSFSAEYGIGGAVFNQITKGGTNGFHGSAYEFFQNNILNAAPHFGGVGAKAAILRYHEWGGSIGGPIIKNKLFFYFVRDKIFNNGAGNPTSGTVPTLAERGQGTLFPGAYDFSAPGLPTLYDPASCATANCRVTFASENTGALAGVNAIPAGSIDPVAAKILSYYPVPNTGVPGALTQNFTTTLTSPNPNLRYFGRIDYDLSQKNRISFSISQKDNPGVNKGGPFACPINCFSGDIDGYNAQVTVTSEISPTMVNELRMAYTKQGNWFVPQTVGFDSASTLGLQYAKADIFPQFNVVPPGGNAGAVVCCSQLAPGTNAIYIEHLYDPSDVLTLIHGRHVLHFGVEVLMGDGNTTPWGNLTAGNFSFTGNYTGGIAGAGAPLADFLLGEVQNWAATNQATSYARLKSPQLFVQDDFKLRPNLTLNLGLRYVATTGFSEKNNAIGGFDPNKTLVCTVDSQGNPCGALNGTLGSLWFAPQDNRTTLQKPRHDIFLPRVGFAWSIRNDTVVRGGFGMYSYNYSQDDYGNGIGAGALTTSTGTAADPLNGGTNTPLIFLSSSSTYADSKLNYVVGSPNAKNVIQYLNVASPSGQTYVPYNVSPGRINQWQLSVEHQFGHSYMASVAYVGSHASNLQFPTDLNQITSPTLLSEIAAGTLPPGQTQQSVRPFPAWGNITGYNYDGKSNYNALQTSFNKHFSNGLLFSFNYVWSHFLDNMDSGGWGSRGGTQDWQIGNNPSANYGNSNFDVTHAIKGYASYELPFGRGKTYLNGNSVVDEVVGGWRLSGTMITQSGNPFTVTTNDNYVHTVSDCNNCVSYPNVVASTHVSNPGPNGWFNPTAFVTASPAGTFAFGNEGRNSLRGPRLTVFNMSIAKSFSFGERVKLELRSDWVNVFNHPSLNTPGNSCNLDGAGVCIAGGQPGGGNFGLINDSTQGNGVAVGARSGQLSARITF
jgi:Carboxypeptidase regulatory-like domain